MRQRQATLLDNLLPKLALDLSAPAPGDLRALFKDVDEVRLESGFGGGEHLIAEAERHPRTGFIGIEPFVNGMAKALAAIDERKLENISLHHGDATDVLAWLPAASSRSLRSAVSRSVAEAPALEAALRARQKRRGDRTAGEAGRGIPLRQRHPRLRGVDLAAADAFAAISLGRRNAQTTGGCRGRIGRHALRGQGQARGPHALLFDFQRS